MPSGKKRNCRDWKNAIMHYKNHVYVYLIGFLVVNHLKVSPARPLNPVVNLERRKNRSQDFFIKQKNVVFREEAWSGGMNGPKK